MRLPITIGAILLASLSFNAPVFSASPVQVAQTLPTNKSNLKQLRINQRLWNRQNIKNYRYTVTNNCFCIPEFRGPSIVEVRNGVTVSITNAETGQPVNSDLFRPYSTVPRLFNLIRNAISSGEPELTVTYNPQLGYPTEINIGNLAADAGIFTTISNFEELP
jgi:hypothetical protein